MTVKPDSQSVHGSGGWGKSTQQVMQAYIASYRGPQGDAPAIGDRGLTAPVQVRAQQVLTPAVMAAHGALAHTRKPGATNIAVYPDDDPSVERDLTGRGRHHRAKQVLADDPNNFSALFITVSFTQALAGQNPTPDVLDQGEKASRALLANLDKIPPNFTEEQWKNQRPQIEALAKESAISQQELDDAVQANLGAKAQVDVAKAAIEAA